MAGLTTHVLDTASGRPAAGMALELAHLGEDDERRILKRVRTNADGRTDEPLLSREESVRGVYEIVFEVGEYFAGRPEVGRRSPVPRPRTAAVRHLRPGGALPRSTPDVPVVLQYLPGELR